MKRAARSIMNEVAIIDALNPFPKEAVVFPQRLQQRLLIEELADETLIFDRVRHRAHCLNQLAACIWRQCDGKSTVAQIAARVSRELKTPVDEPLVWLGLQRLGRRGLLLKPLPSAADLKSRRDMLRKLAAAAVLVPTVMTVVAPTAAQAASSVDTCTGQIGPDVFCRQFKCTGGQQCRNFAGQNCTCR